MQRLAAALLAATLAACRSGATIEAPTPAPGATAVAAEPRPSGQLPRHVEPTHYALRLEIVPARETFAGEVTIQLALERPVVSFWLHAKNLTVRSATLTSGGAALRAQVLQDGTGLAQVQLPTVIAAGDAALSISFEAPFDHSADGVFVRREGADAYAFTQLEAIMARRAFPCFDEPRFKTPWALTLDVPRGDRALANTREIDRKPLENGLDRVRFAPTLPLPSYLIAFAVGPLDVVRGPDVPPSEHRSTPLPLAAVARRGKGPLLAHALAEAPALILILERLIGLPYPYDKLDLVAVPGFPGAMENAALPTFREAALLIDPATAGVDQRRSFAELIAHEVGHQWFGNLVTMPWWDDLWLNEAFATWIETRVAQEWTTSDWPGIEETYWTISAMHEDRQVSVRRIREPITSDDDIINAFDDITYYKGAAVLAMFEHAVGDDVFRRAIRRYLEKHRFATATAGDFIGALSAEASRDLRPAFGSFLDQPGVPYVHVEPRCDQTGAVLELEQSRYLPLGSSASDRAIWSIPLCFSFGVSGSMARRCTTFDTERAVIELESSDCPTWVLPNAGASAYVRWSLSPEGHRALAKHAKNLTPRELLSWSDAIISGLDAGRLSFADAMELTAPLASSPDRRIASAPMALLRRALELLEGAPRQKVERHARELYEAPLERARAQAAKTGSEADEARLFLRGLTEFLAIQARHPGVRRTLAARGRAELGLEKAATPLPVEQRAMALRIAAEDSAPKVYDALVARFETEDDPAQRRAVLAALGAIDRPELAERTRALLLDPRTSTDDVLLMLSRHLDSPANRLPAWAWLQQSFDLISARLSQEYAVELMMIPESLCGERARAEVAQLAERLAKLPGGPRRTEGALEAIDLCTRAAEAQRDSARAFFERRR